MTLLIIFGGLLLVMVVLAIVASPRVPKDITDEDIAREARSGNTLTAIRWYRTLHGAGLKQAKEAVEKMAGGEHGGL
jgi:large subunit ribosomal protein L7/L12